MSKKFKDIVEDAIGKNVKVTFETVTGTTHIFGGKLISVNAGFFEIRNELDKSTFYVNLQLTSLIAIEVID